MHVKRLWSTWQGLALQVAGGFTQPGQRRFVESMHELLMTTFC